jgi:hypothetical protein
MYHIFVAEIAHEGRVKLLSIILIAQISPITGHLPSCKITHLAIPNKALTQGWTIETIQLSAIIHLNRMEPPQSSTEQWEYEVRMILIHSTKTPEQEASFEFRHHKRKKNRHEKKPSLAQEQ